MRYGIFDTETTGIGPDKKAVEIGLMEVDLKLNILGEAETLLNPEALVSAEAAAIHGLTNDMLLAYPTIEQYVKMAFKGKLAGDWTLMGHRIAFDVPLFEPIGNCVDQFDTLPLAQTLLRKGHDVPDHKLETLKDYFGIKGGVPHRAMSDVRYVYAILPLLLEMTGRTLEQHLATPVRIVHRMPWGKHEGTPLHLVPKGYRDWLLTKCSDLDPNLVHSLKQLQLADY